MNLNFLNDYKITINKNIAENLIIFTMFLVSFFNSVTLLLAMVLMFLLFKQGYIGAIKILNLITLRSVINPGIAVRIAQFQNLKWIIIFASSFLLISGFNKIASNKRKNLNYLLYSLTIYCVYSIVSSFFVSGYPIIAMFKVFSYIIPSLGLFIGVSITANKINWINWLFNLFLITVVFSIPLLYSNYGFLRNGISFQGILNHPNLFGVFLSLFSSLVLIKLKSRIGIKKLFYILIYILVIFLAIETNSRTTLLSITIILIVFSLFTNIRLVNKILILFSLILILLIIGISDRQTILSTIVDFIYKGNDNLFFSREKQIGSLIQNFKLSPFFGNGFSVPVINANTYNVSSDYIVEPGNLFLAVLSYGGVIGFIMFIIYLSTLLIYNKDLFTSNAIFFVSPIMISMGEMVFFSTNNIGIWCYMFLAIYNTYNIKQKKGFKNENSISY